MNIEEKKLEQVLNRIKAIFDEEYNKDADKVYWYLVANIPYRQPYCILRRRLQ